MNCPVCKETSLAMTERQGIEIDYCPKCRGIWLDRGELDKIIERSAGDTMAPPPGQPQRTTINERIDDERYYDDDDYKRYGNRRKRKGFLGDLFDFD